MALVLLFGTYALVDGVFAIIGAYAIVFGLVMLALAWRLHNLSSSERRRAAGAA